MPKNEKENKVPPRRGHGPGNGGFEKPKNFKNAISRLLKELNAFKVSVILGLLFAAIGSIISINAPKYLSKNNYKYYRDSLREYWAQSFAKYMYIHDKGFEDTETYKYIDRIVKGECYDKVS